VADAAGGCVAFFGLTKFRLILRLRGVGNGIMSRDVRVNAPGTGDRCGFCLHLFAGPWGHALARLEFCADASRGGVRTLIPHMQTIGFQEAVEALSREDKRYHIEAYAFLRDALEATLKRRKKARKETGGHVAAGELLEGFRLHALEQFGPMAMTVLDYWGVRSCEDVGQMVFNLVQAGVFGKTDEDALDDFRGHYDFREVFVNPFTPGQARLNDPASGGVGSGE